MTAPTSWSEVNAGRRLAWQCSRGRHIFSTSKQRPCDNSDCMCLCHQNFTTETIQTLRHPMRRIKLRGVDGRILPVPIELREPIEKRFWSKVDKTGNCWIWIGYRDKNGYGRFHFRSAGDVIWAHRMVWVLTNGPIPKGLCVLHKCDNPPCVNPEHLFLGTVQDNSDDMNRKGRGDVISAHYAVRKFTSEQIVEMRTRRTNGETIEQIAKDYHSDSGNMSRILSGKFYGDVR